MNPENEKAYDFASRRSDESFRVEVRESFAQLLQDRATDPESAPPSGSQKLYDFGELVRSGQKIPRAPSALEIFRGVFNSEDGGMREYDLAQFEIDALEKFFFEDPSA